MHAPCFSVATTVVASSASSALMHCIPGFAHVAFISHSDKHPEEAPPRSTQITLHGSCSAGVASTTVVQCMSWEGGSQVRPSGFSSWTRQQVALAAPSSSVPWHAGQLQLCVGEGKDDADSVTSRPNPAGALPKTSNVAVGIATRHTPVCGQPG